VVGDALQDLLSAFSAHSLLLADPGLRRQVERLVHEENIVTRCATHSWPDIEAGRRAADHHPENGITRSDFYLRSSRHDHAGAAAARARPRGCSNGSKFRIWGARKTAAGPVRRLPDPQILPRGTLRTADRRRRTAALARVDAAHASPATPFSNTAWPSGRKRFFNLICMAYGAHTFFLCRLVHKTGRFRQSRGELQSASSARSCARGQADRALYERRSSEVQTRREGFTDAGRGTAVGRSRMGFQKEAK